MDRFIFPKWSNKVLTLAVVFGLGPAATAVVGGFWYYGTAKHLEVGYEPDQPVEYSHKLHAGDLGIDCRYCHSPAETGAHAGIPSTETCMNCHAKVRTDSPKLLPIRESYASDKPVAWVRVHNLPDYAYFNHSVHLAAGVGCQTCHGRVDQMPVVRQVEPLSMGWCLDCHRDPKPQLRDPADVTKMGTVNVDFRPRPAGLREVAPPVHCSGCHR